MSRAEPDDARGGECCAGMANSMAKQSDPLRDTLGYWQEVRRILKCDFPQAFTVAEFLQRYLPGYEAMRAKGCFCLLVGNHDIGSFGQQSHRRRAHDARRAVPLCGADIWMRQLGDDLPQVEGAYKPRADAGVSGANLGFYTVNTPSPSTRTRCSTARVGSSDSSTRRRRWPVGVLQSFDQKAFNAAARAGAPRSRSGVMAGRPQR